jgi:hypothetical protein
MEYAAKERIEHKENRGQASLRSMRSMRSFAVNPNI